MIQTLPGTGFLISESRSIGSSAKAPEPRSEVGTPTGTEAFDTTASEAEDEERARLHAERVAIAPGFKESERMASRKIAVMILERTG